MFPRYFAYGRQGPEPGCVRCGLSLARTEAVVCRRRGLTRRRLFRDLLALGLAAALLYSWVTSLRHQFLDDGLICARIQLAELDLPTEFTAARMAMAEHCTAYLTGLSAPWRRGWGV